MRRDRYHIESCVQGKANTKNGPRTRGLSAPHKTSNGTVTDHRGLVLPWDSPGYMTNVWGESTLLLPCARIHTQAAVEMDWLPIAWWHIHRTRAEFTPANGLFQPKMKMYPPSFHSKHMWFYISLLLWKIAGIMLLKVQAGLNPWTRNQFLRYYWRYKYKSIMF